MKLMKLQEHKYSQCNIQVEKSSKDGLIRIVFISYVTPVIYAEETVEAGKFKLYCTGTYSRTTIKQIGFFLKEYFPDLTYFDMKAIAGKDEYRIGCLSNSVKKILQEVVR